MIERYAASEDNPMYNLFYGLGRTDEGLERKLELYLLAGVCLGSSAHFVTLPRLLLRTKISRIPAYIWRLLLLCR